MKNFTYTIKDELGIHVRPAGLLVKEIKKYDSKITIAHGGKTIDARKLMAIMAMGIKQGETVTFTADGADENAAITAIEAFMNANL